MIVANNTIAGLKGMVGTLSLHVGMLITILFWVPNDFADTKEYQADLNDLWWYCMYLHVFLVIVILFNTFLSESTILLSNILTIAGISAYIGLYLVIVIKLTGNWTQYINSGNPGSDVYKAVVWYLIEVFMLLGYALSYMLLLFVRFLFKMRIHLEIPHAYFSVNSDFIEAEGIACQYYITMAAPAFVTIICLKCEDYYTKDDSYKNTSFFVVLLAMQLI